MSFDLARFNFSITYRPSSKNITPDALSHQLSAFDNLKIEESILPTSCVVRIFTWSIQKDIREAQRYEPDPDTGPIGRLFIPRSVRSKVLE